MRFQAIGDETDTNLWFDSFFRSSLFVVFVWFVVLPLPFVKFRAEGRG
jgi:hypothetical protein